MSAEANGRRRVVVTGLGAVTPLGNDIETSWENLLAGESGAGPIQQFDPSEFPVTFACELKDFDPTVWIDRKAARRMDRFTHMILAAARMAEADSGLDRSEEHTSELQSRQYLVCRLLLEKKKNKENTQHQ